MQEFVHEKLDVYRAALAFLQVVDDILEEVPRGRGHLGDQLDRAATSIVLNVAEGAGEFAPAEKARFYRMARRSANECAAVLDVYRARQAVGDTKIAAGRELLLRIVAMLTRMVLNGVRGEQR
jgi:four helix bundle protein